VVSRRELNLQVDWRENRLFCIRFEVGRGFLYAVNVESMYAKNVASLGFKKDDVVQEWLWDDDVEQSLRDEITDITGTELVDEDYNGAVDGVIIWWRDGDAEDELADTIVDAKEMIDEGSPFWIFNPKPGREGAVSPYIITNAAHTAGMNATTVVSLCANWNGVKLTSFGHGNLNNQIREE
jgi:hypothetical protein